MSQHVHSVCQTGYYHMRNVRRIRRYLNKDPTKTLLRALVTSRRLGYYNSLLHGFPRIILRKCNVCRMLARSHITPVLKELHWPTFHSRIQNKILLHTYRTIHHQSPVYLNDLLSIYRPTRSLLSESTILLTVPRTRTVT